MADEIETVMLIGAGGNLGPTILQGLLDANKWTVTVLSRAESKSTFPPDVKVIKTDYSDASLAEVFKGQDAVVSTVAGGALSDQEKLIDAAVKAGVKRFLPSEFGSNTLNKRAQEICPLFGPKAEIIEYLKAKAKEVPSFSWTAVMTGPFFDWCLKIGFTGFDFKSHTATIWDGGDARWSSSNLSLISKGVVGVLTNATQTKNRNIYIQSFVTSQNEILATLQKVQPDVKWQLNHVKSSDMIKIGREKLSKGDMSGIPPLILGAIINGEEDVGADFTKSASVDNALVGLPEKEDLLASVEAVVKSLGA